jgi:hypothetical protein
MYRAVPLIPFHPGSCTEQSRSFLSILGHVQSRPSNSFPSWVMYRAVPLIPFHPGSCTEPSLSFLSILGHVQSSPAHSFPPWVIYTKKS